MHFCVEFKENGTHLANLTKAIATGKRGKLTPVSVAPKLGQAGELSNTSYAALTAMNAGGPECLTRNLYDVSKSAYLTMLDALSQ